MDEVHEIVRLRDRYEDRGISFYLHIDAAYGGYARSLFLNEEMRFMEYAEVGRQQARQGVLHHDTDWLNVSVYESLQSHERGGLNNSGPPTSSAMFLTRPGLS